MNTAGTVVDGVRTWDFSGALAGDADFEIEATFTGDKWYAATFIDETAIDANGFGTYTAPLSAEIDAVFRRTADRLVLLGIASVEEDTTLITYDPPILVLEYPLAVGDTFSSESTGSGTLNLNPFYVSTDEYTTTVDAEGEVITGAGTFPVFRMRVDQSVFVGFFGVTKIQYVWLTPCLGVVAHVDSEDSEDDPDFTTATRVQRVAAPGGE